MQFKYSFQTLNYIFFLIKFVFFFTYIEEIKYFDLFFKIEIFFLILYIFFSNFYFEKVFYEIVKFNTDIKDYERFSVYLNSIFSITFYLFFISFLLLFFLKNLNIQILFLLVINIFFVKYFFSSYYKNKKIQKIFFSIINLISIFIIININNFDLLIIFYLLSILIISIFNKFVLNKEDKDLLNFKNIYLNLKNDLRYIFFIKKIFLSFVFSNSYYFILFSVYFFSKLDQKIIFQIIICQIIFIDILRTFLSNYLHEFYFEIKHLTYNFSKFKDKCKVSFIKYLKLHLTTVLILSIFYFFIDTYILKFNSKINYFYFNFLGIIVYFKLYLLSIIYTRHINASKIIKRIVLQNIIIIPIFYYFLIYFDLNYQLIILLICFYFIIDLIPFLKILKEQKVFKA